MGISESNPGKIKITDTKIGVEKTVPAYGCGLFAYSTRKRKRKKETYSG